MNTFTKDQKVRITPKYAEDAQSGDGSMEEMVGKEGIVRTTTHAGSDYVPVKLDGEDFPWLFLPEELEAV